ncbi:MAG: cytochrome c3 family protein [Acidobacteriota bacterium]|nr:MAG: cytochrome c3 family protein [Acidobacteriota bacterium]
MTAMKRLGAFAGFVGLLGLMGLLFATDAPHDLSFEVECASCHVAHATLGGPLTNATTNALVCQQCHNALSDFPMLETSNVTVPGVVGTTHRWGAEATNTAYGAKPPGNTEMQLRMDGTLITCSTCHDQHETNNWGPQRLSLDEIAGPAGGVVFQVDPAANPKIYLIRIIAGGKAGTEATYVFSNDNERTWWGWTGAAWDEYPASAPARLTSETPTYQELNDGANVQVTFDTSGGDFTAEDRYEFYIGYPFLRAPLDDGVNVFCLDCHAERGMGYADVDGPYTGSNFSHPVGEGLNANLAGYDRGTPLDVDGKAQGASDDTNATNDLALDGGIVRCLTCHDVHYTDSNSATVDK